MDHRYLFSLLAVLALVGCTPQAPPPASVTSRGTDTTEGPTVARRLRVDGMVEANEWATSDTTYVQLPDGRRITVLYQRGPESLNFAFLGLGGNAPRPVHPEILLDVSGQFPAQFGRQSWWFRIAPSRCVANGAVESLECGIQLAGFEASAVPVERRDNLEVSLAFSLLEFSPAIVPQIAFALRFAENTEFAVASWPQAAQLNRPDTWFPLDLSR